MANKNRRFYSPKKCAKPFLLKKLFYKTCEKKFRSKFSIFFKETQIDFEHDAITRKTNLISQKNKGN